MDLPGLVCKEGSVTAQDGRPLQTSRPVHQGKGPLAAAAQERRGRGLPTICHREALLPDRPLFLCWQLEKGQGACSGQNPTRAAGRRGGEEGSRR